LIDQGQRPAADNDGSEAVRRSEIDSKYILRHDFAP
jgi:hypothetical protein